jgi:hypothetical protein
MNKSIILPGIAVIAAIAIGWFILNTGDTFDYVVTVDQEVTELENELAELEAEIAAGTLSEEDATAAKIKIFARLDTINGSVQSSTNAKLTPEQRQKLADGLLRLKDALVSYQSTLTTIDAQANDVEVKAKPRSGSRNSSNKLTVTIAEAIDILETNVEEVIDDYVTDEEVDDIIDDIVEEDSADDDSEDTDSTGDTEMGEDDMSPTTTDPDESDSDLEVNSEAEGEAEVTQ